MPAQATTKDRVLDAALACFTEIGFSQTSVGAIRDRSGVSVGSIYHHFGNKEGVAVALYLRALDSYHAGVLAVLDTAHGGEAVVKGVVGHYVDWVVGHPDMARYLLFMRREATAGDGREKIRAHTKAFLSRVAAVLVPMVERGEVRAVARELYVPLMVGPAQEVIRLWLSGRLGLDPATARDDLADAAWRVFRPDAALPKTAKERKG